jgi:hypothetical protein
MELYPFHMASSVEFDPQIWISFCVLEAYLHVERKDTESFCGIDQRWVLTYKHHVEQQPEESHSHTHARFICRKRAEKRAHCLMPRRADCLLPARAFL